MRMFPKVLRRSLAVLGCVCWCSWGDEVPEQTVRVGGSVRVPCPLASPGGSVQWLQNGAPVVLDPSAPRRRHWHIATDGTAALTIGDARRSDAGRWECRELGPDGGVRDVARVLDLVVGSSPSDPYMEVEGRRLVHQATVTVKEPQTLSLHCVVTGAIPPVRSIQWAIGGESNLTSLASEELFVEFSSSEDAYTSRSVLTLNVTRTLHAKELVCRVQHVTWLQAAAVSASLNVLYEPSFSISREPGFGLPLLSEMQVSLRCEVDANPPSAPLWVKDDGPPIAVQHQGPFLNFTPIGHQHAGWYRCTTHHPFGFFASFGYFLNVRTTDLPASTSDDRGSHGLGNSVNAGCLPDGRPEVSAVNKSLMSMEGKSALLAGQLCSGHRLLSVFWVLRHLVLRPGDVRHPYVAYNLTETEIPNCYMCGLELSQLRVEDSGEVLLVAKNTQGIDDASFILNITLKASLSYAPSSASSSSSLTGVCLLSFLLLCLLQIKGLDTR